MLSGYGQYTVVFQNSSQALDVLPDHIDSS